MKLFPLILIMITISTSVNAQGVGNPIKYDTCSLLQQHVGEWRYTNGSDTIRIYLKLHRGRNISLNYIIDDLWGYVEYKHGNDIVVSDYENRLYTLPYRVDTLGFDKRTIRIRNYSCNQNSINFLVGDLIYRFAGNQDYMVKATINAAGSEMTWHQNFVGTIKSDLSIPNNPPTGLNKMPDDFILIKQP